MYLCMFAVVHTFLWYESTTESMPTVSSLFSTYPQITLQRMLYINNTSFYIFLDAF